MARKKVSENLKIFCKNQFPFDSVAIISGVKSYLSHDFFSIEADGKVYLKIKFFARLPNANQLYFRNTPSTDLSREPQCCIKTWTAMDENNASSVWVIEVPGETSSPERTNNRGGVQVSSEVTSVILLSSSKKAYFWNWWYIPISNLDSDFCFVIFIVPCPGIYVCVSVLFDWRL